MEKATEHVHRCKICNTPTEWCDPEPDGEGGTTVQRAQCDGCAHPPAILLQELKQYEGAIARLRLLTPELHVLEALHEELGNGSIFPSAWYSQPQVSYVMIVDSKDEVTEALRFLARHGYRARGEAKEDKHQKTLTWELHPGESALNWIELRCQFSGKPGARCRYIEVGKKEVPVYELRCDEQNNRGVVRENRDLGGPRA